MSRQHSRKPKLDWSGDGWEGREVKDQNNSQAPPPASKNILLVSITNQDGDGQNAQLRGFKMTVHPPMGDVGVCCHLQEADHDENNFPSFTYIFWKILWFLKVLWITTKKSVFSRLHVIHSLGETETVIMIIIRIMHKIYNHGEGGSREMTTIFTYGMGDC